MQDNSSHQLFLMQALEQAWLGRGRCAPNPAVGAVAVHRDKVIAKGFHQGVGHAHAEKVVLDTIPDDIHDVTLYITLEPCNHWGRTPPCTDAIIKKGVSRVVYAYRDPNPVVAKRNTPHILQTHGIETLHYPMDSVERFYQSYAFWLKTNMPWVTVKMAQSLDGKIAHQNRTPIQLSNADCYLMTHQERLRTDVILTSTQTVLADNPQLTARIEQQIIHKPVAIVGYSHLEPNHLQLLQNPNQTCYVFKTHDLKSVFRSLGEKGYHDVWVEAGANMFQALHQSQLVHTTHLYVTPHVVGPQGLALYQSKARFEAADSIACQAMGDNMLYTFQFQEMSPCLQV